MNKIFLHPLVVLLLSCIINTENKSSDIEYGKYISSYEEDYLEINFENQSDLKIIQVKTGCKIEYQGHYQLKGDTLYFSNVVFRSETGFSCQGLNSTLLSDFEEWEDSYYLIQKLKGSTFEIKFHSEEWRALRKE